MLKHYKVPVLLIEFNPEKVRDSLDVVECVRLRARVPSELYPM